MFTFVLIIILKYNVKKIYAYLILLINTIGVILIIVGMIIGN